MRALLRRHWPLAAVLLIASVVRIGVAIAYWPAVFFGDSWAYLNLAYEGGFAPDRPSGYPQVLHLLSVFGRDLGTITIAQHLAGLFTGVLVYALMLRLRLPRWLATIGAALVLLDAYAIALEQQILAEAFFTLALIASFFLVVGRDRGPVSLAAGGLLLALAATMRTAALFAVPVWLVYVLWSQRALRLAAPAVAALVIPLLAYSAWHSADTGPVRPDGRRRLVPVRPGGGDRGLRQRRHPARRAPALCAQRARPARGRGVPHLERRRPGPARVRRDEPGRAGAGTLQQDPSRLRDSRSSAIVPANTRSWSGTT